MSVFQSSSWQDAWWKIWGQTKGFELLTSGEDCWPRLYVDHYSLKGFLPVQCLQFAGTNYRRLSTPRSEYNALTSSSGDSPGNDSDVIRTILAASWSEAVFRDMPEASPSVSLLRNLAKKNGWLWREVATDITYSIDTSDGWFEYIASLGRNTRLRLFNRRSILERFGDVQLKDAWPENVDDFFELLNSFHSKRWGRPCFNNKSLSFHREFLFSLVQEGGQPDLSILLCSGRPVSVLYNVVFEGCVYNIQAGFEEHYHKKLALGTLHLGYSIEDAFLRKEVVKFDLLAGNGKHEDYKNRIATQSEKLVSVMLVRSPVFKLLYRLKG